MSLEGEGPFLPGRQQLPRARCDSRCAQASGDRACQPAMVSSRDRNEERLALGSRKNPPPLPDTHPKGQVCLSL